MSSNFTIYDVLFMCFTLSSSHYNTIAFNLVNIPLILPLCLYILYLGIQQWRRKAKISHTDFFTYNMVSLQLLSILGSVFVSFNYLVNRKALIMTGFMLIFISASAVVYFQILTCLERYMAVVHPVTYLRLRSQTWALIRNISCAYIWLQCIIQSILIATVEELSGHVTFSITEIFVSFSLVLFCNLRVLCVLIRPGPGDGANVSQSKRRALYTISAIMACLLLKYGGDIFGILIMYKVESIAIDLKCTYWLLSGWFSLPSTLVLPLLFLIRNGKMICLKTSTKGKK